MMTSLGIGMHAFVAAIPMKMATYPKRRISVVSQCSKLFLSVAGSGDGLGHRSRTHQRNPPAGAAGAIRSGWCCR
jgi:hypothetical protein